MELQSLEGRGQGLIWKSDVGGETEETLNLVYFNIVTWTYSYDTCYRAKYEEVRVACRNILLRQKYTVKGHERIDDWGLKCTCFSGSKETLHV